MTEKQQLTLNQENMIKLALMYEDYDLEKMLEKLISIGLAHSTASVYIKDYYRNLYKRIRSELKTLLDCVTYEEVFTRSYKVYDTWNTMENISFSAEITYTIMKKVLSSVGVEQPERSGRSRIRIHARLHHIENRYRERKL